MMAADLAAARTPGSTSKGSSGEPAILLISGKAVARAMDSSLKMRTFGGEGFRKGVRRQDLELSNGHRTKASTAT